jgi:misacylated tRNA(Ala) deacylase
MSSYLYHEAPDLLEHDATVLAAAPGEVLLDRWSLHPGGGGQEPDHATISLDGVELNVIDVTSRAGQYWLRLQQPTLLEKGQRVQLRIDTQRRHVLSQLHTATHILNALVFQRFENALVTGAQISGDGTARMDFDLPSVDNDLLRALEPEVNAAIRSGLEVRTYEVPVQEARSTPGLIRSLSVAPPPSKNGLVRIVDIAGLDRQACGGTHLTNTALSLPVRITKIENKGKQNRRVRIALAPPANG